MRVLYDISSLGFAHLYEQSRGGAYRVDLHISQGLAASGECDLLFCANHSTVAHHGCEAFLRGHPTLGGVPLVAAGDSGVQAAGRVAASAAHRTIRHLFGRNVLPSAVRHVARSIDRQLHPPVTGTGAPVDILHGSLSAPLPPAPKERRPQRFLTVYDLASTRFPDLYGAGYRGYLVAALRSLRPGDHVITTSQFVRDEMLAAGVGSPDYVHVVPLAADRALFSRCDDPERIESVRRRYGVPDGPYVLGVNTPDPRKNVPHAIDAFACASRQRRDVLSSLVLTGHAGSGSDRIQQAIARHPDVRERIIVTGYVPDEDLSPLYTGAQVFVYSSIYEGFGLPPLEAMQCGTPVITSNTSSLPEVVGEGGVMVPPDDLEGLADAMLDLATDTDRRRQLQQRALAQAGRFSWELSTTALLQAYRRALHG